MVSTGGDVEVVTATQRAPRLVQAGRPHTAAPRLSASTPRLHACLHPRRGSTPVCVHAAAPRLSALLRPLAALCMFRVCVLSFGKF